MVSKGFSWVSQPKPKFTCPQDFHDFAQCFPRALVADAIAFAKRTADKSVPPEHSLSGSRQIDLLFWNHNTRSWIEMAHRNPFYKKKLPGYKPSEVFQVIVTALALIVRERLQSPTFDE